MYVHAYKLFYWQMVPGCCMAHHRGGSYQVLTQDGQEWKDIQQLAMRTGAGLVGVNPPGVVPFLSHWTTTPISTIN